MSASFQEGKKLFEVNNNITIVNWNICSKLTIKVPKQSVAIGDKVNKKDTRMMPIASYFTYFTSCSSVSIDNFEHVIAGWVISLFPVHYQVNFPYKPICLS